MDLKRICNVLKSGELVALPTETVYGLAADAANDMAVAKIFAAKGRPSFNPLIIHVENLGAAENIGQFSPAAKKMAEAYWPGPLTIVVPKRDKNFARLATAGLSTIAIRVPKHPAMAEVLKKSGLYLAAPSANISGRLTPTESAHVAANFPGIYIVEGGKCEIGLESTVITFDENDSPIILRRGVLQIEGRTTEDAKIISPGQLLKHYAPKNPIRINAGTALKDETYIGFGNMSAEFNLSPAANLVEAAANLFSMLHAADSLGKKIAVAPIPQAGVGIAINDRLNKAAN